MVWFNFRYFTSTDLTMDLCSLFHLSHAVGCCFMLLFIRSELSVPSVRIRQSFCDAVPSQPVLIRPCTCCRQSLSAHPRTVPLLPYFHNWDNIGSIDANTPFLLRSTSFNLLFITELECGDQHGNVSDM